MLNHSFIEIISSHKIIANSLNDKIQCKVQVYIYIYSLHLALIAEDLLSMICVFQKKDLSLNPKVRQTNSGQSWTSPTSENRYCFVTYLKFWNIRHCSISGQSYRFKNLSLRQKAAFCCFLFLWRVFSLVGNCKERCSSG